MTAFIEIIENLQEQIKELKGMIDNLCVNNDYLAEKVEKLEKEVYHLTWKGIANYDGFDD